jgi:hypothetical protein
VVAEEEASEAVAEAVVGAVGADERRRWWYDNRRSSEMRYFFTNTKYPRRGAVLCALAGACVSAGILFSAQHLRGENGPAGPATASVGAKTFATPQQAADALVAAAEKFDVTALTEIFGPVGTTSCSAVNSRKTASVLPTSRLLRTAS